MVGVSHLSENVVWPRAAAGNLKILFLGLVSNGDWQEALLNPCKDPIEREKCH